MRNPEGVKPMDGLNQLLGSRLGRAHFKLNRGAKLVSTGPRSTNTHRLNMALNRITPLDYTQQLDEAYIALIKEERLAGANLTESAPVIARACAQALGVSRASIWLLSDDQTVLDCISLYSLTSETYEGGLKLEAHTFPNYFKALTNSRFIDAHNAATDPRTKEFTEAYLKPLNIKSLLDATVRHEGRTRGVLCLEMEESQRLWNKEEKMFAAAVADYISQQLILSQLKRSEAKYKALFAGASDAIFVLAKDRILERL